MKKRAIVVGPPFSGKTSSVQLLRKLYPFIVVTELDEQLSIMNGGKWPDNEYHRYRFMIPKVVKTFLNTAEHQVFFTNFIGLDYLKEARRKHVKVVQLMCTEEVLRERDKKHNRKRLAALRENLKFQRELETSGLVDFMIDAKRPVKEMVETLAKFVSPERVGREE